MRTFAHLLRVAFWMLPLQRVLSVTGALVILVGVGNASLNRRFALPGTTLPLVFCGAALMLVVPLLMGGAWLRMLSAPRQMQMLPHARGRLLAGTLGAVLVGTALWIIAYWLAFQQAPVRVRPLPEGYVLMYMLTLTFATQCVIGVFIASRGPVWAALVLLLWIAPHVLLPALGVTDVPRLMTGPGGLAMIAGTWLVFGVWYLKVRRVGHEGWRRTSLGAAAPLAGIARVMTREQAMTRWVLGAATPPTIGLFWTGAVTVLLGIQLLIGRDSPPRAVSAMAVATLSLSAAVIAAMAWSVAARSRGLWLQAGRSRERLFRWCEALLLRVTLAILLPFVGLGLVLWAFVPERPALPAAYLFGALIAPGLAAPWLGLLQIGRRHGELVLFGLAIVAGWFYGLVMPLAQGSADPRWALLAAQVLAILPLRWLAARRWASLDWPRGGRIEPLT